MVAPRDWAEAASQNRAAWEEIADVRMGRWSNRTYTADFFAGGGCSLDARVVEALGDVRGHRVLHLMCATGEESLSLAVLGAHVVAVDISPRQVELATAKADAAGIEVGFVAADVGDLPPAIAAGGFDLVYTGGGVLVWVPDIDRWAAAIARALQSGGRLVLWDYHPVAMRWESVDGTLQIESSYFAGPGPIETQGWTHFAAGRDATTTKYEFAWTLGEIVTGLADAGLCVTRLSEYPTNAAWKFGDVLDAAQDLPGLLLLVARRGPERG
ncbi:MAG: class I SAM-dependent methyltransferase [Acidimicrobiales bacterium]